MDSRIMYIEQKLDGISGPAWIGRVSFNRSKRTIYYKDQTFRRIIGGGFKSNYIDVDTDKEYWISGCHRDGCDRLYSGTIRIDDDIRQEYWTDIRRKPQFSSRTSFHCTGKYSK